MSVETGNVGKLTVPNQLTPRAVDRFESDVADIIRTAPEALWLDCTDLEFVTSSHINLLWRARQECDEAGVRIRLKSPTAGMIRVLKVLDLYEIFECDDESTFAPLADSGWIVTDTIKPTYQHDILANREGIDEALIGFMQLLSDIKLPQLTEFELRTIYYEVATNIRIHSGLSETDSIGFSVRIADRKIILEFADAGVSFDLTSKNNGFEPEEAGRNRQKRGIGISMVHKLADMVSYNRTDDGQNVVTIVKKWE